ncbi:TPA: acyltransferase [Escherichia coli]|nr:acyltransferase [Escherichia coli]
MKAVNYQRLTGNQSVSFDSLRGVSALLVVASHCVQFFFLPTNPEYHKYVAMVSQSSVMLFFVMSGFLITKSITGNISKNGNLDLNDFFVKRFARIYPPLIASFVLVAVIVTFLHISGMPMSDLKGIPKQYSFSDFAISYLPSFMFLNGFLGNFKDIIHGNIGATFINLGVYPSSNAPLWSLSIEVWYYVVAGLAFSGKAKNVILSIAVAYIGYRLNGPFFMFSIVWIAGSICCLMHDGVLKINTITRLLLTLLSCIYLFNCTYYLLTEYSSQNLNKFNVASGLFFAVMIWNLFIVKNIRLRILPSSAKYSYTLYITHFPVVMCIYTISLVFNIDTLYAVVISFISSVLLASWLARYVENVEFFISRLRVLINAYKSKRA